VGIDTAQERYSLIGLGSPVPRLLPIPQGSFAADDRALLIFLYSGLSLGEAVAAETAETPSGGWFREPKARFRHETDADRDARIKDERVRMGILPPDPAPELQRDGLGLSTTLSTVEDDRFAGAGNMVPYRLAAHLLPEDLAGLEALAARAAELTVDQEIAMWLRLEEQRRLHEAWLRDEDDAAVLMLAIATIH
jgi:hypothetical protein